MELADVLEATKPVEVEYAEHVFIAHAYLLGRDRLTKEQRAKMQQFAARESEEEKIDVVDFARAFLSIAVESLQVRKPDGEESEPARITEESVLKLPDALLLDLANRVREGFWTNPTNGADSESILESPAPEERSQEQTAS